MKDSYRMTNSYENIITELFSMDFPNYHYCATTGKYYEHYKVSHKEMSLDDYLMVDGIPDNFKIGDWIKYPSRECSSKVLGVIVYMKKVGSHYGEYILGIKRIDPNNNEIIKWINKFKQFVLEE